MYLYIDNWCKTLYSFLDKFSSNLLRETTRRDPAGTMLGLLFSVVFLWCSNFLSAPSIPPLPCDVLLMFRDAKIQRLSGCRRFYVPTFVGSIICFLLLPALFPCHSLIVQDQRLAIYFLISGMLSGCILIVRLFVPSFAVGSRSPVQTQRAK
jgi:hypothetical protein